MQGGIEAEREERERWINKDVKKMMDSVEGNNQWNNAVALYNYIIM